MLSKVAAGFVTMACGAIERRYRLPRMSLLCAGGLVEHDLEDAEALLPLAALHDIFRAALAATGDPALGLRVAGAIELREQGYWGYALLSCSTMRERIERNLRYLPLRFPCDASFESGPTRAVLEIALRDTPPDLEPVIMEWVVASCCIQHGLRTQTKQPQLGLWLAYREQPHHRDLRAMVRGQVQFDAPCHRLEFPVRDLEQRLGGDPHLSKLLVAKLDAELARDRSEPLDPRAEVRARLHARLATDPSIERIARDLRVSARTLRRQLSAVGTSFQELLEQLRRERAIALLESGEPIEVIAQRLGYSDPSNFRRAFRRWMGVSPAFFRRDRSPCARPGGVAAAAGTASDGA